MEDLQEYIVNQFGAAEVQESYEEKAAEGLWPSEAALIDSYFPDGARVLDLGCGTGRTTIPLTEKGFDVVGIDITPEMIDHAKEGAREKVLDIDYRVGDATDLDLSDGAFEAVLFSNQGWTQIPGRENRREALEEIQRVLKPGGVFIFTTHVRQWRGYTRFWITQWIKLHLLKPLGVSIDEQEFGDRFFQASKTDIAYPDKQFIHIPNVANVIEMVEDVGFELVENTRAQAITADEDHPSNPMFYVCRNGVSSTGRSP